MSTALVTGASGGIGSAIARRLAADGVAVYAGYHRNADGAKALVASLPGSGHRVVQLDVTDPGSLAAAVTAVGDTPLDALVNCAGVTHPVAHDDLDGLTDEFIDEIFATNWRGPFAAIRAFAPSLRAASGAIVVNISSVAGVSGQGSNVAYCASKAALDSMTRSLGRALGPDIRVVSVSPGWVRGEYADRMDPTMLDSQRAATPLGRLATPDDVAAAVAATIFHLPFTTGSVIPVDGGRPLGTT